MMHFVLTCLYRMILSEDCVQPRFWKNVNHGVLLLPERHTAIHSVCYQVHCYDSSEAIPSMGTSYNNNINQTCFCSEASQALGKNIFHSSGVIVSHLLECFQENYRISISTYPGLYF